MNILNKQTITIATTSLLCFAASHVGLGKPAKPAGGAASHMQRGIELAQQKNFDAAVAEFTKAIEANPKDPRGYTNRGTAYRASNPPRLPDAYADFSKAIEVAPDDAYTYKFRGFAEIGLNQWDKAVADFTTAIQKQPDDPQNYDRRAWANRNLKNYDVAVADYTVLIEKDPNDAEHLVKRGATYTSLQQYEKAIADYQAALKIKPDDYDTVQRLQYAQAQLAAKNAPPATPTPTPGTSIFTPAKIFFAVV